jgi:hypothetical protein
MLTRKDFRKVRNRNQVKIPYGLGIKQGRMENRRGMGTKKQGRKIEEIM